LLLESIVIKQGHGPAGKGLPITGVSAPVLASMV
jgi:hypothetical protein